MMSVRIRNIILITLVAAENGQVIVFNDTDRYIKIISPKLLAN